MPFVDLPRRPGADPVSLWYRIQGAHGEPELDPTKPTLLLIHTSFADITGLYMFFDDTRLRRRVNMIAFDQRSHGKTKSTVCAKADMATIGMDMVMALRELNITQKLHLVGTSCAAPVIVNNLACLFPDRWLSITNYGMPLGENEKNFRAYGELADFILYPRDPQEFLQGIDGGFELQFGSSENFSRYLTDHVETILSKVSISRYPPAASRRSWEVWQHAIWRPVLKEEYFASIKCPVLLFRGRYDIAYTPEDLEGYASLFTNAKVRIEELEGPHACFVFNGTELSTMILQLLSEYFELYSTPDDYKPFSTEEFAFALRRAAIMREEGDPGPSVSWEEPLMSEDFTCLSADWEASNAKLLRTLIPLERKHRNWLPVKNYWENGQEDDDFEFNFRARHDYFCDVQGGRTTRVKT